MNLNETLLIMRQNLIKIYKQYETIILMFLKFIVVFSVISMIGDSIGYIGVLNKVEVVLFLSLLGTFLPDKWMVLGFVILTPIYIVMVNLILGAISFLFLWVLYLLFMRLFPKESLLIIAAIVCFNLGIEVILPLVAALFGSYVCIIAIIIGTFIWFVMPEFAVIVKPQGGGKGELLEIINTLTNSGIRSIVGHRTMLSTIVVFFIVFSIVYIIRKQAIDHAPYLAIAIGSIMNLTGFILAMLFLNIDVSMGKIIFTTILAAITAVCAQFFSKALDYQRAETVSFEDEENYYYVKVVPKIHITSSYKKVKRIYNTKAEQSDYMNTMSAPSMNFEQEIGFDE